MGGYDDKNDDVINLLWPTFCSLGGNDLDLDTVKMICELLKTSTTIASLG